MTRYIVTFLFLICMPVLPAMAECECTDGENSDCECGSINSTAGWTLRCDNGYIIVVQNDTTYECQKCPNNYRSSGAYIEFLDKQHWGAGTEYGECTMTTLIHNDDNTGIAIDMVYNEIAPQLNTTYVPNAHDIRQLIQNEREKRTDYIFTGLFDKENRQIYDANLNPTNNAWESTTNILYIKFKEITWNITICLDETDKDEDGKCDNNKLYTRTKTQAKSINTTNLYKFGYEFLGACEKDRDDARCYDKDGNATDQTGSPSDWYSTITPETDLNITMYADFTPIQLEFQFKCETNGEVKYTVNKSFGEILDATDYPVENPALNQEPIMCDANRQTGWQIHDPDALVYCAETSANTNCRTRTYFPYPKQDDYRQQIDMVSYTPIVLIPKNAVSFKDNYGTFILD